MTHRIFFIQDLGTGNLYVDSNSLQIRNATGTETQAVFTDWYHIILQLNYILTIQRRYMMTTSGGFGM